MSDKNWMAAAQAYTRRLGAAEYEAFCRRRKPKKSDKFIASEYLIDLCRLIGEGDEEAFKTRKMLNGRDSVLGV